MKNNLPSSYFQPAVLPPDILDMHYELVNADCNATAKQAAMAIVKEYHRFVGISGMRNSMWLLLSGSVGQADINHMAKATERCNLFFFYEFTLVFMDAVYVLHGEKAGRLLIR